MLDAFERPRDITVYSYKALKVTNAAFSWVFASITTFASNRKQEPRLGTTVSRLKQQENHRLAARGRHLLPSLHSVGNSPHSLSLRSFLVAITTGKDQGLDDSFAFPCCMRSVTCHPISSCFQGDVRRGCIPIRSALPFSILCWAIAIPAWTIAVGIT